MLSQKELIGVLDESNLPGSTKTRKLAIAPKQLRQSLIKGGNKGNRDVQVSAAIEIQRIFRGYKVRCNVFDIVAPKVSTTAVYSNSKHNLERLDDIDDILHQIEVEKTNAEEEPGDDHILSAYNEYMEKLLEDGADPVEKPSLDTFRKAFNQTWEDKLMDDESFEKMVDAKSDSQKPIKTTYSPTQRVQQQYQPYQAIYISPQTSQHTPPCTPQASTVSAKKKREGPLREDEAAVMIQRVWRRHIDVQVYRYYRDLINFKTRGDPTLMLRCINPNEAKLLDPAAGIHVRFRLAGDRFPPNIYYKIFTHRPIVDMCANSPKDYTRAPAKKTKAKDTHNRNRIVNTETDKDGWYRRIENNGWRLVSDRLIHHILSDPVTWQTSQKKYEFHHDKLQRKQDVEKRRKKKKIDWMRKMYKDGMLKAKADDHDTVKLIEGAAAGMVATVDAGGPDALEEWEVDELLDWTTSLNFEDYWTTWKDLATSSNSEQKAVDRLRILTNNMDPYEFTLSTAGPSRFQSTVQSHNTPASSSSGTKIHIHVGT